MEIEHTDYSSLLGLSSKLDYAGKGGTEIILEIDILKFFITVR